MGPGTDESILAALLDDIEALAAADGAGPSGSA
jgi:hypothetical protein